MKRTLGLSLVAASALALPQGEEPIQQSSGMSSIRHATPSGNGLTARGIRLAQNYQKVALNSTAIQPDQTALPTTALGSINVVLQPEDDGTPDSSENEAPNSTAIQPVQTALPTTALGSITVILQPEDDGTADSSEDPEESGKDEKPTDTNSKPAPTSAVHDPYDQERLDRRYCQHGNKETFKCSVFSFREPGHKQRMAPCGDLDQAYKRKKCACLPNVDPKPWYNIQKPYRYYYEPRVMCAPNISFTPEVAHYWKHPGKHIPHRDLTKECKGQHGICRKLTREELDEYAAFWIPHAYGSTHVKDIIGFKRAKDVYGNDVKRSRFVQLDRPVLDLCKCSEYEHNGGYAESMGAIHWYRSNLEKIDGSFDTTGKWRDWEVRKPTYYYVLQWVQKKTEAMWEDWNHP